MAQVLEAVVIGVVILGATFVAVSFQSPPSPQENPGTEQTRSAAQSALRSLDDLYINDPRYDHSALSRGIADAAAGDNSTLVDSISPFLPDNANFCVHINNGQSRIPLHCPKDPPGAAVGVSYPIEPNWRFHYAEPDLRYYDDNSDTQLGLTEIPILNAHNVHDEGDYVNVSIQGTQDWQPGLGMGTTKADFEESAFSTMLQGDKDANYPSAAIYMECQHTDADDAIQPCYASDLSGSMNNYQPYAEEALTDEKILRFTINNTGPGKVAADSTLEIDFPAGLDVNHTIEDQAGFTDIRVKGPDNSERETVVADLASDLGVDRIHLDVGVNVTDARYAYKHVDARLGEGAVSHSQFLLLVQDKKQGEWTGGDSRVTMVSTPKPSGSAENGDPTGRWGVVLPVPYGETSIEKLRFAMEDGDEILTNVDWPAGYDPPPATASKDSVKDGSTLKLAADHFNWTYDNPNGLTYEHYTFAEFQFVVDTDGTQTMASERFSFAQPEANFDNYDPPPQTIQDQPGIWWRSYPPSTDTSECGDSSGCPGYDNDFELTNSDPTAENIIDVHLNWRDVILDSETDYEIASINDNTNIDGQRRKGIKDAMQATQLSVTPRQIAPGERAELHIDAEDLAHFIAETSGLTDMRLETKVYAPWGIPNRTPVKTFEHGRVAGNRESPNDILAMHVNDDDAEDVVTASTDGNVYGIHGENGEEIAGAVFALPEGSGEGSATPSHLTRAIDNQGKDLIGVGTKSGVANFYVINDDFNERWNAPKPEQSIETYGIHTDRDLTGDGVPEVLLSTKAETVENKSDHDQSRLTLWEGADLDGDGTGDVMDGWNWTRNLSALADDPDVENSKLDYGIVIPGKSTKLGHANVGVTGGKGIWANTGMDIGTNAEYLVNKSKEHLINNNPKGTVVEPLNVSAYAKPAGMYGYTKAGQRAFNFSGVRAVEAETAETITDGDKYSGIAMGGADGWAWGLNASGPMYPISGVTVLSSEGYSDVSMANKLEGYMVSREGALLRTMAGWSSYMYHGENDTDGLLIPKTGALAVDAPDAPYMSGDSAVSWWAGATGTILRSTDRLDTIEEKDPVGTLAGSVEGDTDADSLTKALTKLSDLDMQDITFRGVHAVDRNKAWFVGGGVTGTEKSGNGYVVRTRDGGENFTALELDCGDVSCELNAIDHDGEQLWVGGDNGTLLVHGSGMSSDMNLDGDAKIDHRGRVSIPVTADEEVQVDNVTVTWDTAPLDVDINYGEAVTLGNETFKERDIWNKTNGCDDALLNDGYTEDGRCTEADGYEHGSPLRTEDYTVDFGSNSNNTLAENGMLAAGPFKGNDGDVNTDNLLADGYFGPDWYNNSDNLPVTFHVNVTYADNTKDAYTVNVTKDGVNVTEALAGWAYPGQLANGDAYSTPDCLGKVNKSCPSVNSINVTNLGTQDNPSMAGIISADAGNNGSPLYRLAKGTQSWTEVQTPLDISFNDAALSPSHPDRWIAVGDESRVLASEDAGETWDVVPTTNAMRKTEKLRAVDYTHHDAPIIGGGTENGEKMVYNGYTPWGWTETVDLYNKGASDPSIERVNLTSPPIAHVDRHGKSPVTIDIWDEQANGGDGKWLEIYSAKNGPKARNLSGPTDEIRLRFTLDTDDFTRFSPMIRGNLTLWAYDDTDDNASEPGDVVVDLDMEETGKFKDSAGLNHNGEQGWLRLQSMRNPWVKQLGNEEEGHWSIVRNSTVGARVADLEVAPNGSTIWVLTEAIYQHGDPKDAPPVQDPDCATEPTVDVKNQTVDDNNYNNACQDNTLYALDARTGEREEWWDPMAFSNATQKLTVGKDSLIVTTGNDTQKPRVYWMNISSPDKTNNATVGHSTLVPQRLVRADAFPASKSVVTDPVIAMKDTTSGNAKIWAWESPDLGNNWRKMPSLSDEFSFVYEVPNDALYGSRVVVTQVRWNVTDAFDTELVQSARLHNAFEVTPGGQEMPLVPTYTLEVVAWIEDWR